MENRETVTGQVEASEIGPILKTLEDNALRLQDGEVYCRIWYAGGLFGISFAGYEDGPDTALAFQQRSELIVGDHKVFPTRVAVDCAHQ